MKAIILAGGYATRLKPLTDNTPKHLLPVGDQPMINHLLAHLAKTDIEGWYLVTNAKFAGHFEQWKKTTPWDITIVNDKTSSNDDRLGAIGDILYVIDEHNIDDDLFIVGADNLTNMDFNKMMLAFQEYKAPIIGSFDIKDLEVAKHMGVIDVEKELILSFEEKPEQPRSTLISTLFYIIPKAHIATIRECVKSGKTDNAGWLIQALMKKGNVYAIEHKGYWIDIGTKDQYEAALAFFSEK